jgi:activating signal cointegrator complex subunit 3
MLTVLRTLSQYRDYGTLRKNDFKIVYVAPMKALAAEVVRKFSSRLGGNEDEGGLGVSVRELTGMVLCLLWSWLFIPTDFGSQVTCS